MPGSSLRTTLQALCGQIRLAAGKDAGWRFYLDNDHCVVNNWYEDEGRWYWFDGAGMMVRNVWYQYHGNWYYLGADGSHGKRGSRRLTADGTSWTMRAGC